MPTPITCPHCRATLRVPDELRGKKVRCMAQQTFVYRWDGNSPFDT